MHPQPEVTTCPDPENGSTRTIDGVVHVFYDGYWIRYYEPPAETLAAKKSLIDALTKRTFHHTEPGINTPGDRLEDARSAFERENDPGRKRVNAAMLAGALFNRATDIFTTIVELEERGITVTRDNELMRECSACFSEALDLSHNVKHHSGEEGVDELWGEPVKVFTMPIADYYCSRYRKIALAMRDIDVIGETMKSTLCRLDWFSEASALIDDFLLVAKQECEILKGDKDYFEIWPEFVADGEKLQDFTASAPANVPIELEKKIRQGIKLLRSGKDLISWIANVRVPMPVSMKSYLDQCQAFRSSTEVDYRRKTQ
ncbi:MAG: hypothetical protein AAF402_11790, partial [Pseudomonadota bacterium]